MAVQKIREMLKEIYPDGEVNAMRIDKGYDASTGRTGWHAQEFGRSDAVYMGKSVAEVEEFVDAVKSSREG
jgi:hypothetical protein